MHFMDKAPKTTCVFQVSRPYQGFCPDPKHFIVKIEGNEPTIPKFFQAETQNTHIVFWGLMLCSNTQVHQKKLFLVM